MVSLSLRVKLPRNISDWVLIGVIAMGAIFVVRLSQERATLGTEYKRLVQKTGELTITDPAQVHLRALPTNDPLEFAWRMYIPANYTLVVRDGTGSSSSSGYSKPQEFVARVRLMEGDRGAIMVYTKFLGGSSLMSLGDASLAQLLRGHEKELQVEQIAVRTAVSLPATKSATLIKVRLSDQMIAEAERTLSPARLKPYTPVLYELRLEPPGSVP